MAEAISQDALRALWTSAPNGRLCPWEVAKALGLREASRELHGGAPRLPWIAGRLEKVGGGSPSTQALHELFAKIDADPEWFPGKHTGAKRGPKPVLTPGKRKAIAASAMSAKRRRGEEPCVAAIVQACPASTWNPNTGAPFTDRKIREVFQEDCYDIDPDHPWKFQPTASKVYLPKAVKEHRMTMARYILRYKQKPAWWAQHVVWFDPCSSIIPGSQRQWENMRQAIKGGKRWISDNAKMHSPSLKGPPTALRQRSWKGTKVDWFIVLARGKVHVEVMPESWTLSGMGLAQFVDRLPAILKKMLGPRARVPRHVFTDRGTGLYGPAGKAVQEYAAAVEAAGFTLYWGRDAGRQSPDMGDVLLHETAVAWLRKRLAREKPDVPPWQETTALWSK